MLEHTYEMYEYSKKWIEDEKKIWQVLILSDTEWEQVKYLITLLWSF